jgi:hypothetical protein
MGQCSQEAVRPEMARQFGGAMRRRTARFHSLPTQSAAEPLFLQI